jgi:hypothetical protein
MVPVLKVLKFVSLVRPEKYVNRLLGIETCFFPFILVYSRQSQLNQAPEHKGLEKNKNCTKG